MTNIEALEFALSKEEASIRLYKKLLIDNPLIKDLLYLLLNEEEKHKILIQKEIVKRTL